MPRGVQKDAVLAALSPMAVIEHLGLPGRPSRGEWRTRVCPACGEWGRDAIAINLTTGQWKDHAHGCKGDLLDLVARGAGLDLAGNFGRVLELGAAIAGITVDTDPAELARIRAERAALAEQRAAELKARRLAAVKRAAWIWKRADRWSDRGAEYLAGRGLDPRELTRRHLVKFGRHGDPIVALYSSRAQVINVVARKIDPGDGPKTPGLRDAPSAGTLCRPVRQIDRRRLTVITEGVADTLAGALAWPEAVVLGAHGAGNMPAIGQVAGLELARRQGDVPRSARLLLVPHRDKPTPGAPAGVGRLAAERAADAVATGAHAVVDLVELDHKDLADAWRAGWRPA